MLHKFVLFVKTKLLAIIIMRQCFEMNHYFTKKISILYICFSRATYFYFLSANLISVVIVKNYHLYGYRQD